jgi:hypothetical protein
MNFKTTYILFGVLVAMLGLFLLTQLRGKKPGEKTDYVLPSLQAAKVTSQDINTVEIDLHRPQADKLVFVRTQTGWELQHPKVRADSSTLNQVINQLLRASREEQADMTAGLSQYGLETPTASITLHATGDREWTINVGNASTGKENALVYVTSSDLRDTPMAVRRMQFDTVIKDIDAKGAVTFKGVNDYRAKSLLAESAFDITSVKLQEPKHELVALDKTSEGRWRFDKPPFGDADYEGEPSIGTPAPDNPKITGVQGLLQAIADLRVENDQDFGPTGASDSDLAAKGLERGKERLRIEVKRQPGFGEEKKEPVQDALLIGNKADDKGDKFYARLEGENNIEKVPAKKVEAILRIVEDPSALRNRDLLQIETAKVDAIDLKPGDRETIKLRKTGEPAEWKLYDTGTPQKAEDSAVQDLLNALTVKRLIKEFPDAKKTDADLGLDRPSAIVSLWVEGIKKEEKKEEEKKDERAKDEKKESKNVEKKDAKAEAKKEEKKPATTGPALKDEKPTVKLIFGKRDRDLVYVRREAGIDVVRATVPANLLDKASEGRLAFLERKLPTFASNKAVSKLVLARGSETVEAERVKDENWKLNQPKELAGRAADAGKVDRLLADLHDLQAQKLVAEKPSDSELDRLGLKTPAVKVTLTEDKADKKKEEFTYQFGRETDDKSGTYARLGNRDLVFVVNKGVVDALPGDFQEPTVFNFDVAKVKGMKLAGWQDVVGSPFVLELERKTSQEWTAKSPPGFAANSAQAESFMAGLAHLKAERFIDHKGAAKPEYKLDLKDGALEVYVTVEGEKEPLGLTVGGPSGTDGYYAKSTKLPNTIFVVAKGLFESAKSKPAHFKKE